LIVPGTSNAIADPNRVIQSLWVGDALSAMEKLSIASFLAHGHEFRLYTYGPMSGIPNGARIEDASAILPAARIFRYRDHDSYAGFANYFRYKLLLERGGWWVDLDSVCLRPFDFEGDFVFSSQIRERGSQYPNVGFMKAPPSSGILTELWQACTAKDPAHITWGETGPVLLEQVLRRFELDACVQPSRVFCPVPYYDWERVLDPDASWSFAPETRAIHLWNEMWRRAGRDKNASYDPGCLYELLKRRYGIA
jgi:mannosyltransferase OCH1-like enzyme